MFSNRKTDKKGIYKAGGMRFGHSPQRAEPEIYKVLSGFTFIPVKTTTGWVCLTRVYWVYTVQKIFDNRVDLLYNVNTQAGIYRRVLARQYDVCAVSKHEYLTMVMKGELDGKLQCN